MDLKNKVAIVTGASRGIGLSVSQALAARGVRLALIARHPDRLRAAADSISAQGAQAIPLSADVCSAAEVEDAVQRTLAHYGAIDILVTCAFWGPPGSLEQTDEAFWDRTLDTTLKGAFLCTRAVVPTMKKQGHGRIVHIGSLAGKVGEDNRTAYCAAKWGLEGLSAALSVELGKHNIHVHLVSPAATDTPWWRDAGTVLTPQTLERMIPPSAIAEAVCWVLSQPDQVHIPDVPVYNFRNPFEGKGSPFET